jgi:hypothetical protein
VPSLWIAHLLSSRGSSSACLHADERRAGVPSGRCFCARWGGARDLFFALLAPTLPVWRLGKKVWGSGAAPSCTEACGGSVLRVRFSRGFFAGFPGRFGCILAGGRRHADRACRPGICCWFFGCPISFVRRVDRPLVAQRALALRDPQYAPILRISGWTERPWGPLTAVPSKSAYTTSIRIICSYLSMPSPEGYPTKYVIGSREKLRFMHPISQR